jgi:hypothetical protein
LIGFLLILRLRTVFPCIEDRLHFSAVASAARRVCINRPSGLRSQAAGLGPGHPGTEQQIACQSGRREGDGKRRNKARVSGKSCRPFNRGDEKLTA